MDAICKSNVEDDREDRVMNEEAQRYINELQTELSDQKDYQAIVADYEAHIYEMLQHEHIPPNEVYETLVEQLGSPTAVAKIWRQETGITPRKTQWLFVLLNIAIFVGGTVLLICLHLFGWKWLIHVWDTVANIPIFIFGLYAIFWSLLGYEMGKEFGHRGKRLLQRTFVIAIIPNMLFMYIILSHLLQIKTLMMFMVICTLTSMLYPVTFFGYYWGRKVSV